MREKMTEEIEHTLDIRRTQKAIRMLEDAIDGINLAISQLTRRLEEL